MSTTKKEISSAETAKKLGVGLDFVYVLLRSGKLAARKSERQWLVPEEAVNARIKSLRKLDSHA
ncbi:MAG: helix-turn-helix domain-containing protein [Candidatus Acidiferrales bacterium]